MYMPKSIKQLLHNIFQKNHNTQQAIWILLLRYLQNSVRDYLFNFLDYFNVSYSKINQNYKLQLKEYYIFIVSNDNNNIFNLGIF